MKLISTFSNVIIEVEGVSPKDVFGQMAAAAEVLGNNTCGACDSKAVAPTVRVVESNSYYAMKCTGCGSELSFGQKKADGSLFPKRKDKDGNWLPGNGWVKFKRADTAVEYEPTF